MTAVPGVSATFLLGAVTYSNQAKTDMLGVPPELLEEQGAVSQPVACAMAEGVASRAGADWGMAVTGIAGPSGGPPEKPVGLVFLACGRPGKLEARELRLRGTRRQVQDRAVTTALGMILRQLRSQS